jgi:hypothetical protein
MRQLRFALAILAVALTSSASPGFAFVENCPGSMSLEGPPWTCGYTGHGSCANSNCEYDCGTYTTVEETACNES